MSKHRVFIYGSCVSRDTFEHFDPDQFELVQYVARQSALSAYTRPVTLVEPPQLESSFQQRMVSGDFSSSLQTLIPEAAHQTDLVLIDLTDERLGAFVLPDGSVVTRSTEFVSSGAEHTLPAGSQHLPFGTEQHFQYWSQGIAAVGELIRHHMPHATVALLDIPWAEFREDGAPTSPSYGVTATHANPAFRAYIQAATHALGAEVISIAPGEVTSSQDHPWGDAPFHYAEHVYLKIVKELTGAKGRSVWSAATVNELPDFSGQSRAPKDAQPSRIQAPFSSPQQAATSIGPNTDRGPNFLILGAHRSGTAWLEKRLNEHPEIYMAPSSAGSILTSRERAANDAQRASYLKSFQQHRSTPWRGQRSFLYFWTTDGGAFGPRRENPAEIARDFLDGPITLLVSLRNPVTRAISAYWHGVVSGNVSTSTHIFKAMANSGIADIGYYRRHYDAWANSFGEESITVLLYDDLEQNPQAFLTQALRAIGTSFSDGAYDVESIGEPVNRNSSSRSLRRANPMSLSELQVLVEMYRSDIDFVEAITGRNLDHWKDASVLFRDAANARHG